MAAPMVAWTAEQTAVEMGLPMAVRKVDKRAARLGSQSAALSADPTVESKAVP
jgi:hypothetical protein